MSSIAGFDIPKFEMPKIDKSILPNVSDMGLNTGAINSRLKELKTKIKVDGIDTSKFPNMKGTVMDKLKAVPKIANFSLMSLIPSSMFDALDTDSITKDINSQIASMNTGMAGIDQFQMPDDIDQMTAEVLGGSGVDFSSLYSMPSMDPFDTSQYTIDSNFDIDEFKTEASAMTDAAAGDFDLDKYMKEFEGLSL